MRLSETVLEGLAKMVIGDNPLFPYRSSSRITRFFQRCGFSYVHDGTTRKWWAKDRLAELNLGPSHASDLPSDDIISVISELFEPDDFEKSEKQVEPALDGLNKLVKRTGLVAYLDASGRCHLRNAGTGASSSTTLQRLRPLSQEEVAQRQQLAAFLDVATEDEFTAGLLVPFFSGLAFTASVQ